jgi:hypothetical protein
MERLAPVTDSKYHDILDNIVKEGILDAEALRMFHSPDDFVTVSNDDGLHHFETFIYGWLKMNIVVRAISYLLTNSPLPDSNRSNLGAISQVSTN